mgnify:CR=1 FL=1
MGGTQGMLAQAAPKVVSETGKGGPTMPLNPRQQDLDMLWRYYCCANYDARKADWDGRAHLSKIEHEMVATAHLRWRHGLSRPRLQVR